MPVVSLLGHHMLESSIPHGNLNVHLVVQVTVRLCGLHECEQRWRKILDGL